MKYFFIIGLVISNVALGSDNNAPITASTNMPSYSTYDVIDVPAGKTELRIRVTGYGAPPTDQHMSPTQRKLMAYRSSQLDAYRLIAERVQGLNIQAQSSSSNAIAHADSINTSVAATIRGVRLLSTEWQADGTAQTIAEIIIK